MVKVVLSAEAEADLERIGDYIAERSPARALSFVVELRSRIAALGEAPLAFPSCPGVSETAYGAGLSGTT